MSERQCACHSYDKYECYNSRYPLTLDDCFREEERQERRDAGECCECDCHYEDQDDHEPWEVNP